MIRLLHVHNNDGVRALLGTHLHSFTPLYDMREDRSGILTRIHTALSKYKPFLDGIGANAYGWTTDSLLTARDLRFYPSYGYLQTDGISVFQPKTPNDDVMRLWKKCLHYVIAGPSVPIRRYNCQAMYKERRMYGGLMRYPLQSSFGLDTYVSSSNRTLTVTTLAMKTAISARINDAMADLTLDSTDAQFEERYFNAVEPFYDLESARLGLLMALWIRVQQAAPTYKSVDWTYDAVRQELVQTGPVTTEYGKVRSIKAPSAWVNLHLRTGHEEAQRWYYAHRGQGKTHVDTARNIEHMTALGCKPIAIDFSRYDDSVCDDILMYLTQVLHEVGLMASPLDIYTHRLMSHGWLVTADPGLNMSEYVGPAGLGGAERTSVRGMRRTSMSGHGTLLLIKKGGGIASGEKWTKEKGSMINRAAQLYGLARVYGFKKACAIWVNSHWADFVDPKIGIHNSVLSSDDTITMTNMIEGFDDVVDAMSETGIKTKVELEPVYLSTWYDTSGFSFGKASRRVVNLVYPESRKDNPLLYIGGLADMYESVHQYSNQPKASYHVAQLKRMFTDVITEFMASKLVPEELRALFPVNVITTQWRTLGLKIWEAELMNAMYGSKPSMHAGKFGARLLRLISYTREGTFLPQGFDNQLGQLSGLAARAQAKWINKFHNAVNSLEVSQQVRNGITGIANGLDSPALYNMTTREIVIIKKFLKQG